MRMTRNYYEIMGLPKSATSVDIKRKYHDLARQFHPDRATDKELAARLFAQINMAYRTLSDDNKRAMYNGSLEQEEAKRNSASMRPSYVPQQAPSRPLNAAPQQYAPMSRPTSTASQQQVPPARPTPTAPLTSPQSSRPRPAAAPTSSSYYQARLDQSPTSSDTKPLVQGSPTGPMGQPKPAPTLNSSTINAGDNPVVKSLVKQAMSHYNKGEREQSLRIVKSALSLAAANFDALKLMGDIYFDQGRRPEALAAYRDALKVEPDHRALDERVRQLQALVANNPTPTGPTASKTADKQDKPSLLSRFIGGQRSR